VRTAQAQAPAQANTNAAYASGHVLGTVLK
jgi:hypothetical protein